MAYDQAIADLTQQVQERDAEIERLRQIIADAPHDRFCKLTVIASRSGGPPIEFGRPCDCWKSKLTANPS